MTQNQAILKLLRKGWLTGLQALHECGTMKLATRISEIKSEIFYTDYHVIDKWVESNGKRYKAYRVVRVCK